MSSYLPQPPNPGSGGWSPVGPYATSSMPMPPMRSLKGLSVALLVLLILVALAEVAAAGARFNRADLIDEIVSSPLSASEQEAIDADNAVAALSGLHGLLLLSIAVVFIIWQFRHAKNAEMLGTRGGLGPGWAIGGWFVPLANFVLPSVQIFQSSKASDVAARQQGRRPKGSGLVVIWGVVFGLGILLLMGSGALAPSSDDEGDFVVNSFEDLEKVADSDRSAASGHIVLIGAAILGALMVRRLTKKQTDAYAAVAATAASSGLAGAPYSPDPTTGSAWGTPPPPPAAPAPPLPGPSIPPPPGAPPSAPPPPA